MPTVPPSDRWKRLEALFFASLELKPEARAAFLDQNCGSDIELRKELETLLDSVTKTTTGFFAQPVREAALGVVAGRPPRSLSADRVNDPETISRLRTDLVSPVDQKTHAPSRREGSMPGNVIGLAIGDHLRDYEVIGSLGAGGLGEVYKVRHDISHRVEALKVLRASSVESMERFEREIRVLASLNHPNIAALHTAFRQGEHLVMVMEFVEGETLKARLRRSALSLGEVVEYAVQLLSALMYAHAQGVIHRDIKPLNIMITANNRVKLLDFGLALDSFHPGLTATGWVMGSLHYMSPEQVMAKRVDARSDLYSLGATLYELLTGKVPIEGDSQYTIMQGHLHQQPTAPSVINPAIPAKLSEMVLKALAKNPEDRFQSAEDVVAALSSAQFDTITLRQFTATAGTPSAPDAAPASTSKPATPLPARQAVPTPPLAAQMQTTPVAAYSPETLDRITRKLAVYLGPIAGIVVQRAASRHSNLQELYKTLSEEIESAKDREKFLASRNTRHE